VRGWKLVVVTGGEGGPDGQLTEAGDTGLDSGLDGGGVL